MLPFQTFYDVFNGSSHSEINLIVEEIKLIFAVQRSFTILQFESHDV